MAEHDSETSQRQELPDVQAPNGGEYLYHERIFSVSPQLSTCFVCGLEDRYLPCSRFFAQCSASARRITAMFRKGSCRPESEAFNLDASLGAVAITVTACKQHERNLQILRRLTEDGVITVERVRSAEKAEITRGEFHERVCARAQEIWSDKQGERARQDWTVAWRRCIKELKHIPSFAERQEIALRLYEERKEAQALEDWLQAESEEGAHYTIVG